MAETCTPKPLPVLLLERGLLNAEQIAEAQARAARSGMSLRCVLLQQQLVPEQQLARLVAAQAGLVYVDLGTQRIRPDVLSLLDAELARQHAVMPLFRIEDTLTVAIADPLNVFVTDELRLRTKCDIKRVVASETDIQQAIERWYGPARGGPLPPPAAGDATTPARHALDALLHDAIAHRAQQLWLKANGQGLQVRWRIDGVIHDGPAVPAADRRAVLMRLEALAQLDITHHDQAQTGHGRVTLDGHELVLDVRLSPGPDGESATVRLQEPARPLPPLEALGIETAWREELLNRLQSGLGLLWLIAVREEELGVMSAALVAAAQARGAHVVACLQAAGQTQAEVLSAAQAAAAQSLVICGLLGPLTEIPQAKGRGCLTVRFLRRLCSLCALPHEPEPALARQLGLAAHVALFYAHGCPACHGIGFDGELGVCAWSAQPQPEAADAAAGRLRAAALQRVREGATSWEEVARILEAAA